jgi:hypothetical protein
MRAPQHVVIWDNVIIIFVDGHPLSTRAGRCDMPSYEPSAFKAGSFPRQRGAQIRAIELDRRECKSQQCMRYPFVRITGWAIDMQ